MISLIMIFSTIYLFLYSIALSLHNSGYCQSQCQARTLLQFGINLLSNLYLSLHSTHYKLNTHALTILSLTNCLIQNVPIQTNILSSIRLRLCKNAVSKKFQTNLDTVLWTNQQTIQIVARNLKISINLSKNNIQLYEVIALGRILAFVSSQKATLCFETNQQIFCIQAFKYISQVQIPSQMWKLFFQKYKNQPQHEKIIYLRLQTRICFLRVLFYHISSDLFIVLFYSFQLCPRFTNKYFKCNFSVMCHFNFSIVKAQIFLLNILTHCYKQFSCDRQRMLKNIIQTRAFLTNRLVQTFAKFERNKPHINVGTIGHIDHGKTTLTSAITKYLAAQQRAKYIAYDKIDKAPQQKQRGITINTATLQYETQKRHYAHVDCPGHIDYVKNMITGAAKMDAGILVVAATDGPMPQTKEHVLLCRQIGVNQIIVFLNKMDMIKDTQMVDLIEQQLRQLLKKHEYDPEKTVFIRGSAISAIQDLKPEIGEQSIKKLLDAMDQVIPVSKRPIDKPFMMPIESTYNIAGRGAVASGTIEQGKIKIGDQVQFYGYGCKLKSQIVGIQTFNKTLDYGEAGDNIGLLVRGLTRQQMHRGLVMAEPRSMTTSSVLQANIYCLTQQEGGRKNSFSSGYRPQLYYKCADTAAEIFLPENVKIAKPGDNLKIRAKLHFPLTIAKGVRFALREGGKTVAAGVITQILPEDTVLETGKQKKAKQTAPVTQVKKDQKPAETKAGDKKAGDKKVDPKATKPADQKKDAPKDAKKEAPKGQTPPKPATTSTGSKVPPPPPAGKPAATGAKVPPPPPAGKPAATGAKVPPPPPPAAKKTTPPPPPPAKKK